MILLTSTEYVKSHTALNDNTYDKMIVPALERAQDIDLCEVLGECLVEALQDMVENGSISDAANEAYKKLLDRYVQPFLCYTVLANIILEIGQVMGNGGVDTVDDEHRQTLSMDDRGQLQDYWMKSADAYRGKMQRYVKRNRGLYPELNCGACEEGPHLDSAASTTIWLGGSRGRIIRPKNRTL